MRGWAYVMTVLVAVNVALAAFVLVRRLKRDWLFDWMGKSWDSMCWGASWRSAASRSTGHGDALPHVRAAVGRWSGLLFSSLAILVFTAWPEELLFRGLLQNLLARDSKTEWAGWWTASLLFGFSHITNMGFPNWRYAALATIAEFSMAGRGERAARFSRQTLVHAAVDVTWHYCSGPDSERRRKEIRDRLRKRRGWHAEDVEPAPLPEVVLAEDFAQ